MLKTNTNFSSINVLNNAINEIGIAGIFSDLQFREEKLKEYISLLSEPTNDKIIRAEHPDKNKINDIRDRIMQPFTDIKNDLSDIQTLSQDNVYFKKEEEKKKFNQELKNVRQAFKNFYNALNQLPPSSRDYSLISKDAIKILKNIHNSYEEKENEKHFNLIESNQQNFY